MEAAAQGVNGLAISTSPSTLQAALEQLDYVYKFIERNNLYAQNDVYNVNIPENPQGIRITHQGKAKYSDEWVDMGNGTYTQVGQFIFENTKNLDLDTDCVMNGYVSITPMQTDRTNLALYKKLAGYLNQ
jgi:broad specificity polyphosphatase/5'/3'-nucleotidase SurE